MIRLRFAGKVHMGMGCAPDRDFRDACKWQNATPMTDAHRKLQDGSEALSVGNPYEPQL